MADIAKNAAKRVVYDSLSKWCFEADTLPQDSTGIGLWNNQFLTVYPNPANNNVCIETEKGIESVKVYNMMGALVETISANAKTVNVDLNAYSNGIYFFNIRQSDGTVSNQRVVVSH
jgi:hypothetical protein